MNKTKLSGMIENKKKKWHYCKQIQKKKIILTKKKKIMQLK